MCDQSGERKEYTPEYQFNIGANWETAITDGLVLRLAADANYMDDYLYAATLDEETRQDATTVVNARIALAEVDSVWEVALIGRNLTDEEYANRGFYFGNDARDGYAPKQYTQLSEPLVFGANVNYQF